MGGPAYPPSLTSSRVTLPKVERNTWPAAPQVPQAATSTHSRPVFLSILVHCPRPTHTSEGAAHARAAATSTGCDRRQPTARPVGWQRAHHSPRPASPPPDMQLPKLTGNLDGGSSRLLEGSSPGKGEPLGWQEMDWLQARAQDQTLFPAQTAANAGFDLSKCRI